MGSSVLRRSMRLPESTSWMLCSGTGPLVQPDMRYVAETLPWFFSRNSDRTFLAALAGREYCRANHLKDTTCSHTKYHMMTDVLAAKHTTESDIEKDLHGDHFPT